MPSINQTMRRANIQKAWRGRGNILVGCLAVLGVIVVLGIIAALVVWMNWRGWTASTMNAGMKAVVAETKLPAEQVGRINTQIDQLTEAFKNKTIGIEDLAKVAQALQNHPILPVGMLEYVAVSHFQAAGLTDEERAEGRLAVQRIQRALIEGQMVLNDLEAIIEPISQRDADGDLQPMQNPTAPQLRLFTQEATKKADELGIPNEPYEVDIAEQIESLINGTLGRQVVNAPPASGGRALPAPDHDGDGDGTDGQGG